MEEKMHWLFVRAGLMIYIFPWTKLSLQFILIVVVKTGWDRIMILCGPDRYTPRNGHFIQYRSEKCPTWMQSSSWEWESFWGEPFYNLWALQSRSHSHDWSAVVVSGNSWRGQTLITINDNQLWTPPGSGPAVTNRKPDSGDYLEPTKKYSGQGLNNCYHLLISSL